MKKCKNCDDWKCRCGDCMCLIEKNEKWFCDEYQEFCEEIMQCNLFNEDSSCEVTL